MVLVWLAVGAGALVAGLERLDRRRFAISTVDSKDNAFINSPTLCWLYIAQDPGFMPNNVKHLSYNDPICVSEDTGEWEN